MALPRFCPHCGRPVERTGRSIGRCTGCSREVYANSRPTAGVLLVREGQVLLVRRGAEPERGKWDIPGGFLDEGEAPEDGACREMDEELGLTIDRRALRLVLATVHPRPDYAVLDLLFEAPMPDQQPHVASDAAGYGWFPIDDLPEDLAFAATRHALERWRGERQI